MKIINFSHPLTERTIRQIAQYYGETVEVVTIPVQVNVAEDLSLQAQRLVEQTGVGNWDAVPFVVAGFSPIAVAMLPFMTHRVVDGAIDMIVLQRREGPVTEFEREDVSPLPLEETNEIIMASIETKQLSGLAASADGTAVCPGARAGISTNGTVDCRHFLSRG